MREIIFRGKRVDNDEWMYGFLRCGNYIDVWVPHTWKDEDGSTGEYATVESYQVDPKTVGQYMGLTDKNGKKIFEGDIVSYEDCPASDYYRETIITNRGVIEFSNGAFYVTERETVEMDDLIYDGTMNCDVVGNIYDNKGLLEND